MQTIYERLGEENLSQLVEKFYGFVMGDERISHLFQTDLDLVKEKQKSFLTQFFGGPPRYLEKFGHPMMRARHLPHKIDKDAAMVWLECMAKALHELPIEEELKDEVFNRFPKVAAHMVNC